MSKTAISIRIDEELLAWLDDNAPRLNTTRTGLLEDGVRHAATTLRDANANFGELWNELARRYGEDAELLTYLVEDAEGNPRAQIRINGEEPKDLRGHVSRDPSRKLAHVFIEIDSLPNERHATYHIGSQVVATSPLLAAVALPWPVEPGDQRTAALSRIGDILHGGARKREIADLAEL